MQISLSLHIIWLFLSIINVSQGQRSCGFYMTLLPFTLTGLATLAVDIIFMVLFLEDMNYTRTEVEILNYINTDHQLHWISQELPLRNSSLVSHNEDTTWISLMFAYGSCRGVVQWIINLWLIKDNYFEGLALYRRLQKEKPTRRH
ncbi:uncharacterized protein [Epargyreus clarus]|uniref:uncharacterized protein n=1 Tax=Epargyreus clarus TaxID=520877 RepID=UPI003C2C96BE